ncbi:uncharacterized protein LOC144229222 [Crocuta crocuta]
MIGIHNYSIHLKLEEANTVKLLFAEEAGSFEKRQRAETVMDSRVIHGGICVETAGYGGCREHLQHLLQDPVKPSHGLPDRSVLVPGKQPSRSCSYDELSHRIPWNKN